MAAMASRAKKGAAELPSLTEGATVTLQGLQSAAAYNNCSAIVLNPPLKEDKGRIRVQICNNGKVISVKPSNVRRSRDVFWWIQSTVDKTGVGYSLLEIVRAKAGLATMDNCVDFAQALWEELCEVPPRLALCEDEIQLHEIIADANGRRAHTMIWFGLEAIAHHFILEQKCGRWRIHQAHVHSRNGLGLSVDWHHGRGFTAVSLLPLRLRACNKDDELAWLIIQHPSYPTSKTHRESGLVRPRKVPTSWRRTKRTRGATAGGVPWEQGRSRSSSASS